MISFKVIQNNEADIAAIAGCTLSVDEVDFANEIISSLDTSLDDVEYAASFGAGCLLLRIFDTGRYLFSFPFEITADADLSHAISLIGEYAMRQELPPVFVDVPCDALNLFSVYRHMTGGYETDTSMLGEGFGKSMVDKALEIVELVK